MQLLIIVFEMYQGGGKLTSEKKMFVMFRNPIARHTHLLRILVEHAHFRCNPHGD